MEEVGEERPGQSMASPGGPTVFAMDSGGVMMSCR